MNRPCPPAVAVMIGLLCVAAGPTSAPAPTLLSVAAKGGRLSGDAVDRLSASVEQRERDNASDTSADRAKLLGYYLSRRADNRDARLKQVLWMIGHHTADPFTVSAYCSIDSDDADAVKSATAAWEAAIKANPTDPAVGANAALFFTATDPGRAADLLNAAITADPRNPAWRIRLADLDDRRAAAHAEAAARFSAEALQSRLTAYSLTQEPAARFEVLIKAPADAVRSGDMAAAKRLAAQLLATAQSFRSDPAYGQAVHLGHIALGKAAVAANDLATADDELAAAGHAPPSPGIAADGPDLSLAQDLLGRGEKTAVRDYLDACTAQWPGGGQRLHGWIAAIDDGQTPTMQK
jgi:hypothetical protein